MKVKALYHLHQHVGTLTVERPVHAVFDLDKETAAQASAAGLVQVLEDRNDPPKRTAAKYRETK